jgi:hypothetical protein
MNSENGTNLVTKTRLTRATTSRTVSPRAGNDAFREASVVSLVHLRSFQALVQERSMTRAASVLGIAVSSVSTHVRALGDELGFAILRRSDGGYVPTESGRAVLESCSIVLAEIDRMRAASVRPPSPRPGTRRTKQDTPCRCRGAAA